MKLDNILLEFDPVGDVSKEVDGRMKKVLGSHRDLRSLESSLKGALTLNPTGMNSNATAVAVAHKVILDVLWDSMKDEKSAGGTVGDAFENAAIILSGTNADFLRSLNFHARQANKIIESEIQDAIKLLEQASTKSQ